MTALSQLAAWAANVSTAHTASAYTTATHAFIDTLGCMLIGSRHPLSHKAKDAVAQWGAGQATVIGHGVQLPAPWAALVNGTSAHIHDLDDWEFPGHSHPSGPLVAALLAAGETCEASGRALLDAYIVGLETLMRIGEAINLGHYHSGWHATSTLGSLGAAVACLRLLGGDAAQIGSGLSLAVSRAAGFKSQFGTEAKPLHPGFAAQTGVMMAQLALSDIAAATDVLDGPWSVLTLQTTPDAPGYAAPLRKLGRGLAIDEYGLAHKLYPSCDYTHPAIDAMLDLREHDRLCAAAVANITVHLPEQARQTLALDQPNSGTEAKFSMPYCVATALIQGPLTVQDFTDAALTRPEIVAFMPKVALQPYAPTAEGGDQLTHAVRVTVTLRDGQTLTKQVDHAKGTPQQPLSQDEIWGKFTPLAESVMDDRDVKALQALLQDFCQLKNVKTMMEIIA